MLVSLEQYGTHLGRYLPPIGLEEKIEKSCEERGISCTHELDREKLCHRKANIAERYKALS